jgi:hypothetical protein
VGEAWAIGPCAGTCRKGCVMKVIRTRVGVAVASCGLLASAFGLTAVAVSSAAAGTVSIASGASLTFCPRATVIEAGLCTPM